MNVNDKLSKKWPEEFRVHLTDHKIMSVTSYTGSMSYLCHKVNKTAGRGSCPLIRPYKAISTPFHPVSMRCLLLYIFTSDEYHMKIHL